jgi:hypothetical protein
MDSADAWVTVAAPRRRKPPGGAAARPLAAPLRPSPGAAAASSFSASSSSSDDGASADDAGDVTLGPGGLLVVRGGSPAASLDDSSASGDDAGDGGAACAAEAPQWSAAGQERGAGWGRVPNLWWRAPRGDALRRHARFTALPPVAAIALASDAALACVRQDSALWAAAHAGRLTGGALLGALGCREAAAARRLGLPKGAASRVHAAAAAQRLREAPFALPHAAAAGGAEGTDGDAEARARAVAQAAADNAAAIAAYNARLAAGDADEDDADAGAAAEAEGGEEDADASAGTAAAAPAAAPAPRRKRSGKKGSRSRRGSGAAAAARSAAAAPGVAGVPGGDARVAAAAAAAGGAAVRCAWGSAQEGGTLYALLCAFPEAQLREVGLCCLAPGAAAAAAAAAGLPPGALAALPPLGASPDALIAWPAGSTWAPAPAGASGSPSLEVVEVKNVCPFREAQPAGSKRRGSGAQRAYTLSDAAPHAAPPHAHLPQLQLEMAAAGVTSGLLVIESATRGMAVWRLRRDDAYVGAMLGLLSTFAALYGAQGGPLPASPHAELFPAAGPGGGAAAAHAAFLRRTASLAAEAQLLDFIAAPRRPPDADARPFLDC